MATRAREAVGKAVRGKKTAAKKKAPAKKPEKKASKKKAAKKAPKKAGRKAARPRPVDAEHARRVGDRLARAIPEPLCELRFESPWQLLVATILAAQSTDATVNKVTPVLFRAYPTPEALASAPPEDVQRIVFSTGFFRNKTKAIQAASRRLVDAFGSVVPSTLEELVTLPGVARKTANVVIGIAYAVPTGIAVDTHVGRVSRRTELSFQNDPDKVEADLSAVFPKDEWIAITHRLVLHGRYVCFSQTPACEACPLNELCPAAEKPPAGTWEERAAAERTLVESKLARTFAVIEPLASSEEADREVQGADRLAQGFAPDQDEAVVDGDGTDGSLQA